MRVESYATDGTLNVLVYSLEGRGFRSGTGRPLMIPVETRNGGRADGTVTLAGVIVANGQAERVPAVITTNTVKVAARPAAFALRTNWPNPFNPGTRIAYDVPQVAHVTVVVYNLLGQEIVRLVDEPKTPGRYEVTWDGRNRQGRGVASGVYLYRLTTSTGFSQTRRMALVK
ncbi:MAG: T9SS type A sorting domain-containing protein [Candidatus Latescibacteria bacterium]|nr:T9SS type A sorting domain-containing protein [Candidatus Latescibacterota bacterium]